MKFYRKPYHKSVANERVVRRFAFLPVTLPKGLTWQMRWLEMVTVRQKNFFSIFNQNYHWEDFEFV